MKKLIILISITLILVPTLVTAACKCRTYVVDKGSNWFQTGQQFNVECGTYNNQPHIRLTRWVDNKLKIYDNPLHNPSKFILTKTYNINQNNQRHNWWWQNVEFCNKHKLNYR